METDPEQFGVDREVPTVLEVVVLVVIQRKLVDKGVSVQQKLVELDELAQVLPVLDRGVSVQQKLVELNELAQVCPVLDREESAQLRLVEFVALEAH